jgi:hypothetical protein
MAKAKIGPVQIRLQVLHRFRAPDFAGNSSQLFGSLWQDVFHLSIGLDECISALLAPKVLIGLDSAQVVKKWCC